MVLVTDQGRNLVGSVIIHLIPARQDPRFSLFNTDRNIAPILSEAVQKTLAGGANEL